MSEDEAKMQKRKILLMKMAMAGGFIVFCFMVWQVETIIILLKYILIATLNK